MSSPKRHNTEMTAPEEAEMANVTAADAASGTIDGTHKVAKVEAPKESGLRVCYVCQDEKSDDTKMICCPAGDAPVLGPPSDQPKAPASKHYVCESHLEEAYFSSCGICKTPWGVGDRSKMPHQLALQEQAARNEQVFLSLVTAMANDDLSFGELTDLATAREFWRMFQSLNDGDLRQFSEQVTRSDRNFELFAFLVDLVWVDHQLDASNIFIHFASRSDLYYHLSVSPCLRFWKWLKQKGWLRLMLARPGDCYALDVLHYALYDGNVSVSKFITEAINSEGVLLHQVYSVQQCLRFSTKWLLQSLSVFERMSPLMKGLCVINREVIERMAWFPKDPRVIKYIADHPEAGAVEAMWERFHRMIGNPWSDRSYDLSNEQLEQLLKLSPPGWIYKLASPNSPIQAALKAYLPLVVMDVNTGETSVYRRGDWDAKGLKAAPLEQKIDKFMGTLIGNDLLLVDKKKLRATRPPPIETELELKGVGVAFFKKGGDHSPHFYHLLANHVTLFNWTNGVREYKAHNDPQPLADIKPNTLIRFATCFVNTFNAKPWADK